MPSKKPQSKVYLTPGQAQAEQQAIEASGLSASDFRRLAIKQLVEQHNIVFPDNMPSHGGTRAQTRKEQ